MNPRNGYDFEVLSSVMSAETATTTADAGVILYAGVSPVVDAVRIDHYFAEPFEFEDLAAILRRWLAEAAAKNRDAQLCRVRNPLSIRPIHRPIRRTP